MVLRFRLESVRGQGKVGVRHLVVMVKVRLRG